MNRSHLIHHNPNLKSLRQSLLIQRKNGFPQNLLESSEGRRLSYKEALSFLDKKISDGLVYLPSCDNVGSNGECLGHKE